VNASAFTSAHEILEALVHVATGPQIYLIRRFRRGRRLGKFLNGVPICVNLRNLRTIIYSVTITIQASIESEWVDWMNSVHVPDVLRTACFLECRFYKVLGSEGDELTFVLQYRCRSVEEYHRYRDNFSPALQKEHSDRFSGRFRGSRQLLEEIAQIEAD
jgi:hypothetical protein